MTQNDEGSLRSQASGEVVDLRELVAERLASWGISYVPQRSDDPIYDRLAEQVVDDVLAPELERRDAEIARLEALALEKHGLFQGWRSAAMEDRRQKLALWVERDALRAQLADAREQVERTRRAERSSIASVLTGMLDELEAAYVGEFGDGPAESREKLRAVQAFSIELFATSGPAELDDLAAPVSESVPATPRRQWGIRFPDGTVRLQSGEQAAREFVAHWEDAEAVSRLVPEWEPATCVCNGGWTVDENYQPEDYERNDSPRPEKGLIPCGFCNHGGWDAPWPPVDAAPPAAASADTTPRVWREGDLEPIEEGLTVASKDGITWWRKASGEWKGSAGYGMASWHSLLMHKLRLVEVLANTELEAEK